MITVTLLGLLIVSGGVDSRRQTIDLMDHYYQTQFANLEMIKEGVFGASRVEISNIKHHSRKGGDPGYDPKEVVTEVKIFGNQGKKLDPGSIRQRFHRLRSPGKAGDPMAPAPWGDKVDPLIRFAARQSNSGRLGPFSKEVGEWLVEVRRINLSKRECVSCHKGLKQGEAVALIAYMARKR